jgi:hypothetical protein
MEGSENYYIIANLSITRALPSGAGQTLADREQRRHGSALAQIAQHRVPRGWRDVPHQIKVVAATPAAVAGSVDERADNVDAKPADGAFFSRCIEIRHAEGERVESRPVVDESYPEAPRSPPERHSDASTPGMRSITMRYGVGEELFENDQKPRPLVIRQTAFVRKLVGEGLQPSELLMLGT